MANFDAVAMAMILAPKGSRRVMGEFQALRSVLPGASATTIQGLIGPWEDAGKPDAGTPGVVERRGVCLVIDRYAVAKWATAWLAAGGASYDVLRKALTGGRTATSSPVPKIVAAPAKPARRVNAVPAAKPALSKKEMERRARADRKARNAERNAARRERQRQLALEQAAVETQPEPASEPAVVEESQQIAVATVSPAPDVAEQFTNDWIDERYWQCRKRMSHAAARQCVWDKIFYNLQGSGYSHPECSREAQRAALRINQVTQYQRAAQEAAA